jgi:tRNA-Thr(GGU) m(6)t(6)A37 methyltransferase TsaA
MAALISLSTLTVIVPGVTAAAAGQRPPDLSSPAAAAPTAGETGRPQVKLSLASLGVVRREGQRTFLVLDQKYAPGLVSLDDFSHVMVFYWCDRNDTPEKRAFLQGYRRNKANPLTGVFATRSPVRPNPIAITTCKIIQIQGNIVEIERIDAFENSPVIDLKPYIPRNDSFPGAKIPVWVQ